MTLENVLLAVHVGFTGLGNPDLEVPSDSVIGIFGHIKEDTIRLLIYQSGFSGQDILVGKNMENNAGIGERLPGISEKKDSCENVTIKRDKTYIGTLARRRPSSSVEH